MSELFPQDARKYKGWDQGEKPQKSAKKEEQPKGRFKVRFDKTTSEHDFITIFMNGASIGSLCLKKIETGAFTEALRIGCKKLRYPYEVDISQIEKIVEKG